MSKSFALLWILVALAQAGCNRQSYFVSPYNGNNSVYHPIPLHADSIRSAYYAHVAFALGSANDEGADEVQTLHTGLSGSHNFGIFQGFYSLQVSAGNYRVAPWDDQQEAKNQFFGGWGGEGGLNVVASFGNDEWRVLGIEAAWKQEWGDYLRFRKRLDYGAVDVLVKSPAFQTLGGYTEFVARRQDIAVGFRLAYGTVLGRSYRRRYLNNPYDRDYLTYRYSHFTIHLTRKKYTGFIRTHFATKASSALFGVNYRLGK